MDRFNIKIKKEPNDEEISVEYHDISRSPPTVNPKIELDISENQTNEVTETEETSLTTECQNITLKQEDTKIIKDSHENIKILPNLTNVAPNSQVSSKSIYVEKNKNVRSRSHGEMPRMPSTSFKSHMPFSQTFGAAGFLHTQVRSNTVLQSLLKDIVSLNNENDEEDDDFIKQEIERLRSKNNLPSFNVEESTYFNDSDNYSNDEDDVLSETCGKDSGFENESQYSESFEEDNKGEIQENSRNAVNRSKDEEQEYIDLDNYYDTHNKRKLPYLKGSLADIRNLAKISDDVQTKTFNDVKCVNINKSSKLRKLLEKGKYSRKKSPKKRRQSSPLTKIKLTECVGTKEKLIEQAEKHLDKKVRRENICESDGVDIVELVDDETTDSGAIRINYIFKSKLASIKSEPEDTFID